MGERAAVQELSRTQRQRHEVRLAGSGGQGLILAGIILAEAAGLYDGFHVVQTQVYGPESRGGASRADVIISPEEIDYPKTTAPQALLAMSQDAYDRFAHSLAPGGLLLYDSGTVEHRYALGEARRALGLPFTRISTQELGRAVVATIMGLGALVVWTGVVTPEALEKAVAGRAPRGTRELNLAALRRGFDLGQQAREGTL